MSTIRVSVGTKKGAFILTSDGRRDKWEVSGPHFAGWEIYHLKGSPVNPDRLYASQSSGWFGQMIQRSDDGGRTWTPVGKDFNYDGVPGTHQWYDGTQHPWEFKRIWHLEPSPTDPDLVYAGAEDAALFKTTDGGQTWQELPALRGVKSHLWQPGAGGMGLHTILIDPKRPERIYIAISAAGAFANPGEAGWRCAFGDGRNDNHRCCPGCARSEVSRAARDYSRSDQGPAALLRPILCVQGRPLPRKSRHQIAGRDLFRRRAILDCGSDGWRIIVVLPIQVSVQAMRWSRGRLQESRLAPNAAKQTFLCSTSISRNPTARITSI